MYHDEFARKPASGRTFRRDEMRTSAALEAGGDLAMGVGGGLSLGLAASFDQSLSMTLFYLGGLLPLVACSASMAARRAVEWIATLAPALEVARPSVLPLPHLRASTARVAGPRALRVGSRSVH